MKYFSIAGVSIVLAVLAAGCIGPGTTFVGPDTHNGQTPPGLWRTVGGDGCYWARLDATGAIIENEFSPGGPRYAMIEPTDGLFETQGCITWWQQSPNNALGIGLVGVPGQPFDQGDFLVKAEITPGQYVAAGSPSGCYWRVHQDRTDSVPRPHRLLTITSVADRSLSRSNPPTTASRRLVAGRGSGRGAEDPAGRSES